MSFPQNITAAGVFPFFQESQLLWFAVSQERNGHELCWLNFIDIFFAQEVERFSCHLRILVLYLIAAAHFIY